MTNPDIHDITKAMIADGILAEAEAEHAAGLIRFILGIAADAAAPVIKQLECERDAARTAVDGLNITGQRLMAERDDARAERDRLAVAVERVREAAQRLNLPMLRRLRSCAADTSPSWDRAVTVYPPETRGLIDLLDALKILDGYPSEAANG